MRSRGLGSEKMKFLITKRHFRYYIFLVFWASDDETKHEINRLITAAVRLSLNILAKQIQSFVLCWFWEEKKFKVISSFDLVILIIIFSFLADDHGGCPGSTSHNSSLSKISFQLIAASYGFLPFSLHQPGFPGLFTKH